TMPADRGMSTQTAGFSPGDPDGTSDGGAPDTPGAPTPMPPATGGPPPADRGGPALPQPVSAFGGTAPGASEPSGGSTVNAGLAPTAAGGRPGGEHEHQRT